MSARAVRALLALVVVVHVTAFNISFATYSLGLDAASLGVPDYAGRKNKLLSPGFLEKELDADVVCLTDIWEDPDLRTVRELLQGKYKHSLSFIDTEVGRYASNPPCHYAQINEVTECVREKCFAEANSGSNCTKGDCTPIDFVACIETKCSRAISSLLQTRCMNCILSHVKTHGHNFAEICTVDLSRHYDYTYGLLLLSKKELYQSNKRSLDWYFWPRGVLYSEVNLDSGRLGVVCTSLSSDLTSRGIPYNKFIGEQTSWAEEQLSQINDIMDISSLRDNVVYMGNFNMGPTVPGIAGVSEDQFWNLTTWQDFNLTTPYLTPAYWKSTTNTTVPPCTACARPENLMARPDAESAILEHILIKNYHRAEVARIKLLFKNATIVPLENVGPTRTMVSDRFGVEILFQVPAPATHSFVTFNTNQELGLDIGLRDDRMFALTKELQDITFDADVICLQEMHDYTALMDFLVVIRDTFSEVHALVDPQETQREGDPPCIMSQKQAVEVCFESECASDQSYDCLRRRCSLQAANILGTPCSNCLQMSFSQLPLEYPYSPTLPSLSPEEVQFSHLMDYCVLTSRRFDVTAGLALLSKLPLKATDQTMLDWSDQPRGVLFAELDSAQGKIGAFCTQLSPENPAFRNANSQYATAQEENLAQMQGLKAFVESKNMPIQVIMGDLAAGPGRSFIDEFSLAPVTVNPILEKNFKSMTDDGWSSPFVSSNEMECTHCASNTNPDHVLVKNVDSSAVVDQRRLFLSSFSYTPDIESDRTERELVSDHFGVQVGLKLVDNSPPVSSALSLVPLGTLLSLLAALVLAL